MLPLFSMRHLKPDHGNGSGVDATLMWASVYYDFIITCSKEVTISDAKPEGSNVTDFEATDRDEGQDGRIDYSITAGNEDGFFDISGMGFGEVIVQRSPILPHTYTLTITATDHGAPPRSTNATLIIRVTTSQVVDCNLNEFG